MPESKSTKTTKKTVKSTKTAPKKSAPKKIATHVKRSESKDSAAETQVSQPRRKFAVPRIPLKRNQIILAIGIIAFLVLLYSLKGFFIVAMVNGQPITRLHLAQELQKQNGKQVLDQLVTKKVIEQEANKQDVSVSDDEINKEIKTIEDRVKSSGQSLEQLLAFQGMSRSDLEENIRIQKLVEKLAAGKVTVTDKEVNDYIAQNADAIPEGQSDADTKKSVKEQLLQQKKTEAIQKWVQDVRSKASIEYPDGDFAPQS